MFPGFTEELIEYYSKIKIENSREHFRVLREQYERCVHEPLMQLFFSVLPTIESIDSDLCTKMSRCISTPYADARFSRANPIKEYFYLRYRLTSPCRDNVPGFFLDASIDGYRFGMKIYNPDGKGMHAVRDHIVGTRRRALGIMSKVEERGLFEINGADFKVDHYPDFEPSLKRVLNKRTLSVDRDSPHDDAFFSGLLSVRLTEGFLTLEPLYLLLKDALA